MRHVSTATQKGQNKQVPQPFILMVFLLMFRAFCVYSMRGGSSDWLVVFSYLYFFIIFLNQPTEGICLKRLSIKYTLDLFMYSIIHFTSLTTVYNIAQFKDSIQRD